MGLAMKARVTKQEVSDALKAMRLTFLQDASHAFGLTMATAAAYQSVSMFTWFS